MKFYESMLPYAQRAAVALGMPVSVILGQWGIESGKGTSKIAVQYNNFGGIKYTKYADGKTAASPEGDAYASYKSIDSFVNDYIRVMNSSYYTDVRNANTVDGTIKALSASPYAGSHYKDKNGKITLYNVINSDGLTRYDNQVPGTVALSSLNLQLPDISSLDDKQIKTLALLGAGVLALVAVNKK